jgi:hypothetical protein
MNDGLIRQETRLPVYIGAVGRRTTGSASSGTTTLAGGRRVLDVPSRRRLTLVLPAGGKSRSPDRPPTHPAWRWGLLGVIAPSHGREHTGGESVHICGYFPRRPSHRCQYTSVRWFGRRTGKASSGTTTTPALADCSACQPEAGSQVRLRDRPAAVETIESTQTHPGDGSGSGHRITARTPAAKATAATKAYRRA